MVTRNRQRRWRKSSRRRPGLLVFCHHTGTRMGRARGDKASHAGNRNAPKRERGRATCAARPLPVIATSYSGRVSCTPPMWLSA